MVVNLLWIEFCIIKEVVRLLYMVKFLTNEVFFLNLSVYGRSLGMLVVPVGYGGKWKRISVQKSNV